MNKLRVRDERLFCILFKKYKDTLKMYQLLDVNEDLAREILTDKQYDKIMNNESTLIISGHSKFNKDELNLLNNN